MPKSHDWWVDVGLSMSQAKEAGRDILEDRDEIRDRWQPKGSGYDFGLGFGYGTAQFSVGPNIEQAEKVRQDIVTWAESVGYKFRPPTEPMPEDLSDDSMSYSGTYDDLADEDDPGVTN